MSLRYTGEATMDEPALRDVERWKDKIEVRLDNRQVFFLFFGSAMVACMLFVLGVIVGKRLESRGRAEAPVIEDPLAALDRFSAPASATPAGTALAFPHTLINNNPPKTRGEVEHLAARTTLATTLPATSRKLAERTADKAPEKAIERAVEKAPRVAAASSAEAPVAAHEAPAKKLALVESPATPAKKVAPIEAPASTAAKKTALLPHPVTAAAAPSTKPAPATAPATAKGAFAKAEAAPAKSVTTVAAKMSPASPASPAHAAGKGNFLLQLSSFQDRAEADAFAHRFSGQNAYVVASEVPGKGLWYRVRVGSYGTMKDAAAAKTAFEREHGVIAYVAGTGPAQ